MSLSDEENPFVKLPRLQAGKGFGFLEGVRVIDLTTSVAGPYCTMLLADFGAEVIKIERPAGDDARKWGPPFLDGESLWFVAVNRGKKSLVLDVAEEEDYRSLIKLVAQADVVVTNQPVSVQNKLKLDFETLSSSKEDLIFTSITGFGLSGARADRPCYDLIAEGYSGVMDVTGQAGGDPQKIGAPAADMLAGQDAAMATFAALFDRSRTGRGRKIDISMVESMTRFLTCRITPYLGSGEIPTRSGGTDSVIAIYQAFDTKDHPITLGLGSDGIWQRFWDVVGDPAYGSRKDLSDNASRRLQRYRIVADIQEILIKQPRQYWLDLFVEARIPSGPINSVDQLVADDGMIDRGLFYALESSGRSVPQVGLGIHIDDTVSVPRSMPPRLGEHMSELEALMRPRNQDKK